MLLIFNRLRSVIRSLTRVTASNLSAGVVQRRSIGFWGSGSFAGKGDNGGMSDTNPISEVSAELRRGGALDVVAQYGVPLQVYSGRGTLTAIQYRGPNTAGPEEFTCSFVGAQLSSGRILVACNIDPIAGGMNLRMNAQFLSGVTDEGWHIQAREMTQTDSLDADEITGGSAFWLAFDANILECFAGPEETRGGIAEWRYGLTNYLFDGSYFTRGDHTLSHACSFRLPEHASAAPDVLTILTGIEEYRVTSRTLRVLKGVAITAEVLIRAEHTVDHAPPTDLIEALVYVLSVGAGCKCQPIYRRAFDGAGTLVEVRHEARIVRPFSSQALIPATAGNRDINRKYVERGVAAYLAWIKKLPLNLVLDAYLDAKSEGDFLEARGAKLAVALEALKHEFEPQLGGLLAGPHMDKERFAELEAELVQCARDWFRRRNFPAMLEEDMIADDSFRDLNRATFRDLVTALTEFLDLFTTPEEIREVVASRNKLVHQGQFACVAAAVEKGLPKPPAKELISEYLSVVHLLDRIVLRLLDYDGLYYRQGYDGKALLQIAIKSTI